MPVTKEQFLARMAAGRAKKAAERTAATPAAAAPAPAKSAPKPNTKTVTAAPVTTVRQTAIYITDPTLKAPKPKITRAVKSSEAPLA
jgi:hypothetical protein